MSRILGLIPARGGSKGIPGKNLKPLAGKPLLQYTIEVARASGLCERLLVSTDSHEIADYARAAGIDMPFLRPSRLATDETPMLDVVAHALVMLSQVLGEDPTMILLLQPTAPLRRAVHLQEAVDRLRDGQGSSVVSVVDVPLTHSPDLVWRLEPRGTLVPFGGADVTRRQLARPAVRRDGTVYAMWAATIRAGSLYGPRCLPLVLPETDTCPLDTLEDWAALEARLASR